MTVPSGATTGNVVVTVGGVDSNPYSFTVPGTPSSSIYYYIEDSLGSSRAIVQDGATAPCYDADFYPFGGERIIADTCPQNYKFQGKERDAETGNDDFGARYYSNRFGRWLSADWSSVPAPVPYANLTNPQTLNLYAMVSDNPETFADLDGHCWHWASKICNVGQRFDNLVHGEGFHTDRQVDEAHDRAAQFLHQNGANTEKYTYKRLAKLGFALGTRPSAKQARAIYEKATGEKVPFDENLNRYYDMNHKTAIVDGGAPRDPKNLEPMQNDEHVKMHQENGDYARWGQRAQQGTEEPSTVTPGDKAIAEGEGIQNEPPPVVDPNGPDSSE